MWILAIMTISIFTVVFDSATAGGHSTPFKQNAFGVKFLILCCQLQVRSGPKASAGTASNVNIILSIFS